MEARSDLGGTYDADTTACCGIVLSVLSKIVQLITENENCKSKIPNESLPFQLRFQIGDCGLNPYVITRIPQLRRVASSTVAQGYGGQAQ